MMAVARDVLTPWRMTMPRQVIPGSFHLVTRRCTQRQFLLRPDDVTNETFTYCLAEAAERFGICVILPMAMSNHHHTVVFDRDGTIIEFTQHFHKMFAKAQNAHRGRSENLWSSEPPSIVRIDDPERVLDALVYTALNPVKDGLVARVADWPGVSGLDALLEDRPINAKRPGHYFREDGPMPEEVTLELVIPPELGDPDEVRAELRRRVAEEEARHAEERKRSGRGFLGRLAVLRQSWKESPTTEEAPRTIKPRFAAKYLWQRIEAMTAARAFVAAYRKARERWLAGLEAVFPPGTYWLHRYAGVPVAPFQS
jgi:hypothetical protein